MKVNRQIPLTQGGWPDQRFNPDKHGYLGGRSSGGKQVRAAGGMGLLASVDVGASGL